MKALGKWFRFPTTTFLLQVLLDSQNRRWPAA